MKLLPIIVKKPEVDPLLKNEWTPVISELKYKSIVLTQRYNQAAMVALAMTFGVLNGLFWAVIYSRFVYFLGTGI